MITFAERLRSLRMEQALSQGALAEALGVSKSSINMYERGEREPGFELMASIAGFFEVDTDYLLGRSCYKNKEEWLRAEGSVPASAEVRRLPVLGEIACGAPIFAEEEYECFAEADPGLRADLCLRARGDSMIGARIMDGDLVFIRRQETVENGAIAAVIIEDTATLKRVYYYPEQETLALHAENPAYPPLIYRGAELEQVHILGKAVAFRSDLL